MRRTWNSWTYYGDVDPARDEETVCQETVFQGTGRRPGSGEKDEPAKGMLEDAYGRSIEQSMADALERAMDLSDVRNERVARVKRAIEGGEYRVASKELAQRLIRNMRGEYQ